MSTYTVGKPRVWEVEFFIMSPYEIENNLSVMEVKYAELYDSNAIPQANVPRGKVEKENGLLDLRMGSVERKRRCRTCSLYGGPRGMSWTFRTHQFTRSGVLRDAVVVV